MSNDQHTPTAVPWLPTSAPRVVAPATRVAAPPPGPPNPWARMAATSDFNPPPKYRKRRKARLTGPSLAVVLVIGGAAAYRNMDFADKDSPRQQIAAPITIPTAVAAPVNTPFAVNTEAVSFVLPTTPTIELLDQEVMGVTMAGTGWTIDSGGMVISVLAMNVTSAGEFSVQGGFDGMTAGVVERSGGTLVSDTWSTADGVYERMTVSTFEGGYFFQRGFAKGTWMVSIIGVASGSEPPLWFADLVASFSFADVS